MGGWRVATDAVSPDLTLMLDMAVDQASTRLNRNLDRIEALRYWFLNRVRDGFLKEAGQSPDRIAVIDAARDISSVQDDIRAVAQRVIEARGKSIR